MGAGAALRPAGCFRKSTSMKSSSGVFQRSRTKTGASPWIARENSDGQIVCRWPPGSHQGARWAENGVGDDRAAVIEGSESAGLAGGGARSFATRVPDRLYG